MKKILLLSVAGVALIAAGSASAADLGRPVYKAPPPVAPPVPVFSWSGCFVGAHVGWGWGRKDVHESQFTEPQSGGRLTESASGRIDTSGGIFGGQVGCDYQFGVGKGSGGLGAWVIGIQGDLAGTDINGFDRDPIDPNDSGDLLRVKQDWIASVTGRIGWAGWNPQVLFYFKGGGAWTHDRWDLVASDLVFGTSVASQSRSGWTVGGGIEWAFAPNWSAFVEADFYDFGTKNLVSFRRDSESDLQVLDVKQQVETVKVGVNYRFNWLLGKGKAPVMARY